MTERSGRKPRPETYESMAHLRCLEMGCGPHKIHAHAVGADLLDYPGVDLVGPIPESLVDLPDGEFDVIYSHHFLEHVESVPTVVDQCARLLDSHGVLIVVVPHFSNPFFYSDPTHRNPFGLYSMSYFATDQIHVRQVPKYTVNDVGFRIKSAELRFERSLRRPLSYLIGRTAERACRASRRFTEFYEYRLVWLLPCQEIRFELERT